MSMKKTNSKIDEHDINFKKFLLRAHKGFEKGASEHGEGSNRRMKLILEAQKELVDCSCYCFFEFERLERLKLKLRRIK